MQELRESQIESGASALQSSNPALTEAFTASVPQRWKPSFNPWVITLTVTLATFMEVLDTSIANVALPHIAGNLAASQSEATWVISSYLVANAVSLPLSGHMATLIGRKRFYMLCVAIFGISSLFCGLAPNLGTLLLFRVLQGLGGGGLQTSEQANLLAYIDIIRLFAYFSFAVIPFCFIVKRPRPGQAPVH
jgi:MFS transporter, DHA2 family, multidrug resistance protein